MLNNLLKTKRFLPLLLTQFLGALNDNLFKNALLTTIAIKFTAQSDILSNVVAGLFILPFFLFSATAGEVADIYRRDKIARVLKVTEFLLMSGVAVVYVFHSLPLLIALLALMGTQSAFFGPIKYALLPQLLQKEELVSANAYVEASTYAAILLGLILGTLLPMPWAVALLITLSLVGIITAWHIPTAVAPRPQEKLNLNIFKAIRQNFKIIRQNKIVFRCILGATWFWTIGALVAVQIYPLAGQILNASEGVITLFLVIFSIGVAIGSLSCSKILRGLIHATYVPLGALGMGIGLYGICRLTADYPTAETLVTFTAFFTQPHAWGIMFCLFLLAFSGGLYIVPLNALMQYHAPTAHTASVIAGNNIINSLGMCLSAVLAIVLLSLGCTIPDIFGVMAFISLLVFFYISLLLPDAFIRSLFQTVLSMLYRVKIEGLTNLRRTGRKAVIIANHSSLLDGVLIAAFMPEPITIAINTEWAKKWYVRLLSKAVHFFPIDPTSPMSLRAMIEEVKKDKKLMIFPEGRITVTGGLMKVYEGAGVIAEKADAPLLAVRISGAQYSKLSYLNGILKTRLFPEIKMTLLKPEKIHIEESIKGRDRRHVTSLKLYELMAEMMYKTSPIEENLFTALLEAARQNGWKHKIVEDISRTPLSYKALIMKSYVLGAAFQQAFPVEARIGLMLPNTAVNVISFFALTAVDKTPVMINFSQGPLQVTSSVKTVGLKSIITSHRFIEQGRLQKLEAALLETGVKLIYLEDFAKTVTLFTKLKGLYHFIAKTLPQKEADKEAVILFTSGSEGMPKAVLLSHKNLMANRYQVASVIAFNCTDVFFNALPMFHSFGLSIGTILTLLSGVKTFFYPSPLHYRIVPELVYDTNATIICGTDTFFYGYGRMAHPYDFFKLKYAVVGGEKLKDSTRDLWAEKFGIRILEGYGATETAPVISLNTPMNIKRGTVGRLLPAITTRLEALPGLEEGQKLLVKGDNVMLGYIKADAPEKLCPLKGGWYDTGDIVKIDEDGFITILGRAKRFAKVAGEMVSLTAVESALDKLYEGAVQGIVTAPDEKKGERLILITNREDATLSEIKTYFTKLGFSELWIPKSVIYMKKPPVLGTGKFDYTTAANELKESE